MSFVLTILARPAGGDTAALGDDGNVAVLETEAMMSKAIAGGALGYDAVLKRATYVEDIADILAGYEDNRPAIIQIIGHGMSGRLQLGEYWKKSPLNPARGPAVLDSNPESYGLLNGLILESTRVLLLGCFVGSAAPGGYIASGRALMFDLEDMTGASIYAANDLVRPMDFEDGFLFRGPLVMSSGKDANPVYLRRDETREGPLLNPPVRAPLAVKGVLSAPALGFREPLNDPGSSLRKLFGGYQLLENPPRALFAMTEMVLDTDHGPAEVIAGLQYVRVRKGEETLFFGPSDQIRPGVPSETLNLRDAYLRQRSGGIIS